MLVASRSSVSLALFLLLAGSLSAMSRRLGSLRMLSSSAGTPSSPAWLLTYGYVEGILEKRAPHRAAHLQLLTDLQSKGLLKAAGAFNPPTGAAFLFKAPRSEVEGFVAADPYIKAGLVTGHQIQEWTIAVGGL